MKMNQTARAGSQQRTANAMRLKAWVGILAWATALPAFLPGFVAAAADAPARMERLAEPVDLQQESRHMALHGMPMVVLYSQADCRYCDQVRAHLLPMAREQATQPAERQHALFRQVNLDSNAPLTDFSGRPTTQSAFSKAQAIRFTPTVVVYGPDGRTLGEPILGVRIPDFYSQYVEQAIGQAREALRAQRP